jgi:hypothetical protein
MGKMLQNGDKVRDSQLLITVFYFSFLLLLLLPMETKIVDLGSDALSLNMVIVAQVMLMTVFLT